MLARALLLGMLGVALLGDGGLGQPATAADDAFYPVSLTLKTPRKKPPAAGGPLDKLELGIWIPKDVPVLRGAFVNPFSAKSTEPPKELRHWHEAGRLWGFAVINANYDGVANAEWFPLFEAALKEVADKSGHPELVQVPFLFAGMSRGGGWSKKFAAQYPTRTIAVAPVCLEAAPDTPELRAIPFLTVFGEKDGGQMQKITTNLPVQRAEGAQWGIAVQWGRGHEFALANNVVIPFFDEAIRRRLPSDKSAKDGPVPLQPYPSDQVWLGEVSAWSEKKHTAEIAAAAEFKGSVGGAAWLAGPRVAHAWRAFVAASKAVKITAPPGLGDGQPFIAHTAGEPITVKVELPTGAKCVRLFNGDAKLEEKSTAPFEFTVTLSAGIHPLFVAAELADGSVQYSRPHTLIVRVK